jgi:hypothetical protein
MPKFEGFNGDHATKIKQAYEAARKGLNSLYGQIKAGGTIRGTKFDGMFTTNMETMAVGEELESNFNKSLCAWSDGRRVGLDFVGP